MYGIDKTYVQNEASEAYRGLYEELMNQVGEEIAKDCFEEGVALKNQGDYSNAILMLEKAWYFNSEDPEILYHLAETYQDSEDMDKASELYNQLIIDFPDSEYADMAERNIADAATVGNNDNDRGQEDNADGTGQGNPAE